MSSLLSPLKAQLKRLTTEAQNVQRQGALLVKAIDRTSTTNADEVESRFLTFAEVLIRFIQDVRQVGLYSREFQALDGVADKLADEVLKLEHLDIVAGVDYIGLARRIETVQSEEIAVLAVREVASLDGGPERLRWIRQAIDEVL